MFFPPTGVSRYLYRENIMAFGGIGYLFCYELKDQ